MDAKGGMATLADRLGHRCRSGRHFSSGKHCLHACFHGFICQQTMPWGKRYLFIHEIKIRHKTNGKDYAVAFQHM